MSTSEIVEASEIDTTILMHIDGFLNTMVSILAAVLIMGWMRWTLWITSPTGKTTRKMPFYEALRIIRKHGWHMTLVAPIKPNRIISRWQALKILISGDH